MKDKVEAGFKNMLYSFTTLYFYKVLPHCIVI